MVSGALTHFHEIFQPEPQTLRDAKQLNIWLQDHRNRGIRYLRRTQVRQRGPNALRNRERLLTAIEELQAQGMIRQYIEGKTAMLDLMPWQINQQPSGNRY